MLGMTGFCGAGNIAGAGIYPATTHLNDFGALVLAAQIVRLADLPYFEK